MTIQEKNMNHEEEFNQRTEYLDVRIDRKKANQQRPTKIEIFKTQVKVTKKRVGGERRMDYDNRKPRTRSRKYSDAVKRSLMHKLMNESGLVSFVTLTYPSSTFMFSPDDFREHRSRLLRLFRKLKISGIIIAESQENRNEPHYHLVLDKTVEKDEMLRMWAKATGLNYNDIFFQFRGVRIKPITDMESLASYLAKSEQKKRELPVKWWAGFGRYRRKVEPLVTKEGTAESLVHETRIARKLEESERRKQSIARGGRQIRFKDHGSTGFSLYGESAKAFSRLRMSGFRIPFYKL
jgi:hypothetical protein